MEIALDMSLKSFQDHTSIMVYDKVFIIIFFFLCFWSTEIFGRIAALLPPLLISLINKSRKELSFLDKSEKVVAEVEKGSARELCIMSHRSSNQTVNYFFLVRRFDSC